MKKDFEYNIAEMGPFFNLSWTAKKIEFQKSHFEKVEEEIRLENKTDKRLTLKIEEHEIFKHPKKVELKPYEVKHIILKLLCNKIKNHHKSNLVIKSSKQTEKIPISIKHSK